MFTLHCGRFLTCQVGKWLRYYVDYDKPQKPSGEIVFLVRKLREMAVYCKSAPIYIIALDGKTVTCILLFCTFVGSR